MNAPQQRSVASLGGGLLDEGSRPTGALYLSTAFHCNLAFSSIPPSQRTLVLDRCYWPLLELAAEDVSPLGIELSASTLREIRDMDPSWVQRLVALWESGAVEVIGSGEIQAIFPLQPADVNARNLALGQREYERLLGRRPTAAYLNEQVYAAGLVPLYLEAGFDLLIAEWNNVAKHAGLPRSAQYRPILAQSPDGSAIVVVWNNSIAFQKLQRLAAGQLEPDAYYEFVAGQRGAEPRALMAYGSDAEVFDYTPGEFSLGLDWARQRGDWDRIRAAWRRLSCADGIVFVTPHEVVRLLPPTARAQLESSEYPLPTKKQEKYNVTRWAVGGRDNVMINTECERVAHQLKRATGVARAVGEDSAPLERLADASIELWASDARTHTTESKHERFLEQLGWVTHELSAIELRLLGVVALRAPLTVVNPLGVPWAGEPAELSLRFRPGQFRRVRRVLVDDRPCPAQLEDVSRYRDGSLRTAVLVLEPEIPPYAAVPVELIDDGSAPIEETTHVGCAEVTTPAVQVRFIPERGGAVESLAFAALGNEPLCGTLPHGYYEDIAYAADFYTGHAILLTPEARQRITDLVPAEGSCPVRLDAYPIRIPVAWRVPSSVGEWWKLYHVYQRRPRLDLTLHLRLQESRVLSFRIGIVTLFPTAFDAARLSYRTVNGGRVVEEFGLNGRRVRHDEAVSHSVTASHCVGGTEGWVDLGDDDRGICIARRLDRLFSVPMVQHEPVDESFFCRILHSVGESDDTSRGFWRGHRTARFSFLGHGAELEPTRNAVHAWSTGLVPAGPLAAVGSDAAI